jgi:2,4-dienoyl-CoA reductase-like NADH-dependent reductase (Old Yellow Enzyme family)
MASERSSPANTNGRQRKGKRTMNHRRPTPFDPITIEGIHIRNRFVRSATWDSTATDDGEVTDASVKMIENVARGGVGLIVTGFAYVSDHGKAVVRQLGISHDRHIEGMRRLVKAAHDHGAKIAAQIVHAGINLILLGHTDRVALAPSKTEAHRSPHRAMTSAEVEEIVRDFGAAAERAVEAGFDAVQLHGAHGYLMSQFLSPPRNRRTDKWGGSPERRRRFHVEVMRSVRRAVGEDYPIWIKMGLQDHADNGLQLSEGLAALKILTAEGLSAVEISAGLGGRAARVRRPEDDERAYFREDSAKAKRAVDIPVMLVGGIRSLAMAEDILRRGDADMISMSRPLIREPGLIARWQRGDTAPAKCISCNKCFEFGVRGEPLECGEERRLREEASAD